MASAEHSVVKTLSSSHIRVLAMKLQVPYLPVEYAKRPNIVSLLASGHPVRIIQAAAGYGKSSLMAEWLNSERHKGIPVAWLTLDPKENDSGRFLLYLLSAVNSVMPTVGAQLFDDLEKGIGHSEIFTQWVAELEALPVKDDANTALILALDDCHHLINDAVRDFIDQLIDYLPPQIKLVCSSRKEWHKPMGRLQTMGKVTVINEQHLKLSWEETKQWLKVHGVADQNDYQIGQIHRLSEGWLTGLQLIHSCSSDCDLAQVKADEPLIQSYFQEVMEAELSHEEKHIYAQLAVLQCASGPYLESVFGIQQATEKLQQLLHRHCFLLRDEHRPSWYRLHPLLGNLLLLHVDKTEQSQTLIKASEWLSKQGETTLAIELALQSGDKRKAAELVEMTAESILAVQDIAQLLSWKEQLPLDIIGASPRMVIIFSWTLAFAQQLDEAERLMAQIDKFLPLGMDDKNDEVSGQLFAIRGYIARVRGKIDNAIQLSLQALEKLPHEKYVARAVTYFNLSNAFMTLDKIPEAREIGRAHV